MIRLIIFIMIFLGLGGQILCPVNSQATTNLYDNETVRSNLRKSQYRFNIQMLDDKWQLSLIEFLKTERNIKYRIKAVSLLCKLQSSDLLYLYKEQLQHYVTMSKLGVDEFRMFGLYCEAYMAVVPEPDIDLVEIILNIFAYKSESVKDSSYSYEIIADCWWGPMLAITYLAENGYDQFLPLFMKIQQEVESYNPHWIRPKHYTLRVPVKFYDEVSAVISFAIDRLEDSDRGPLEILLDNYDAAEFTSERRLLMNIIRIMTDHREKTVEGKNPIFPFKLQYEKNRYLHLRERALKHVGIKPRTIPLYKVTLVDGTHPKGPMSEQEIGSELNSIKEKFFPQIASDWEKVKPTLKTASGLTVFKALQDASLREKPTDDYRVKMPRVDDETF